MFIPKRYINYNYCYYYLSDSAKVLLNEYYKVIKIWLS